MANTFFIKKQAGKEVKNCFRITSDPTSVPEAVRDCVRFCTDGSILIDNVDNKTEHVERCNPGEVIVYETTTDSALPRGWNLYVKGNAATTLLEQNGKFYRLPSIVEAQFVTEEFPEFIRGAKITHNEDGTWSLDCGWAVVSGYPGDIWAKYGVNADGSIDANIIAVSQTDTINDYFVCTADGEVIEPLAEYLKKHC